MTEIDELLRRDRAAGIIPEVPDAGYTAAAVARRLKASAVGHGTCDSPADRVRGAHGDADRSTRWEWPVLGAAACTALGSGTLAVALGLNPWWLVTVPFAVIPLVPIFARKGV